MRQNMLIMLMLAGCAQRPDTTLGPGEAAASDSASNNKPPPPPKYDDKAVYVFSDRSARGREQVFFFQGTQCAAQECAFPTYTQRTMFACKDAPPEVMELVRVWAARQADHAPPIQPHEFFYARVVLPAGQPDRSVNEFFENDNQEIAKFFEVLKAQIMKPGNRVEALPEFVASRRETRMFFGEFE